MKCNVCEDIEMELIAHSGIANYYKCNICKKHITYNIIDNVTENETYTINYNSEKYQANIVYFPTFTDVTIFEDLPFPDDDIFLYTQKFFYKKTFNNDNVISKEYIYKLTYKAIKLNSIS